MRRATRVLAIPFRPIPAGSAKWSPPSSMRYSRSRPAVEAFNRNGVTASMTRCLASRLWKTEGRRAGAFKRCSMASSCGSAPTTVLVGSTQDVSRTDWPTPVRLAHFSRLDPPPNSAKSWRTGEGTVDIVIGTHRCSGDVFPDLGLVVIDKEQRLGVRQRERLKQLRTTWMSHLTATPVPGPCTSRLSGVRTVADPHPPGTGCRSSPCDFLTDHLTPEPARRNWTAVGRSSPCPIASRRSTPPPSTSGAWSGAPPSTLRTARWRRGNSILQ